MMKRIYSWAYGWSFTMKPGAYGNNRRRISQSDILVMKAGGQSWPTCYITGRFVREKQYASKE